MIMEPTKIILKGIIDVVAIALLFIIALYFYEFRVVEFEDYADILTAVPSQENFTSMDAIDFYIFTNPTNRVNVDDIQTSQNLVCDTDDGNGYTTIASSSTSIARKNLKESVDVVAILDSHSNRSYNQISGELRHIASNSYDSIPYQYSVNFDGDTPNESASCFTKFDFEVQTEFFKINKTKTIQSHPFRMN